MFTFQVHFNAQQRVGPHSPIYNDVINTTLDFCKFLNGSDIFNPVMSWLLEFAKKTLPLEYIHPCPYFGVMQAKNLTFIPTSRIIQFPKGFYKFILRFFDNFDDDIATATYGAQVL